MVDSCGVDLESNDLYTSLIAGEDVVFPDIDLDGAEFLVPSTVGNPLYVPVEGLTNDDLTTRTIDGTGTFDALMAAAKVHLQAEFEKGRITGAEYTKAYIAMMESAMGNATQYLLGRDQAYWNAVTSQLQARLAEVQVVNARVQIQTAKVQYVSVKFEALSSKSNFTLNKIKLANEGVQYCIAKYQKESLLPQQLALVTAQVNLTKEQMEAQRAQTLNTRTDGTAVLGSIGKQRDLYGQQITSYQRDAEVKAAKLFTDAWITMKTMDEGLAPPSNFANASLDDILATLKVNNDLV